MKVIMILALAAMALAFSGCSSAQVGSAVASVIEDITVQDAWKAVESGKKQFIDVRTPDEYKGGHAKGVKNMPLDELDKELAQLDKSEPVYLICQSGGRSRKAAEKMEKAGFKKLYNIKGGSSEWVSAGLPVEQ